MKILNFPQGSEEWRAARVGKVTASPIEKVLAKIKSGEAAARRDYKAQIITEILTGTPQDNSFLNDEMRWGTETEPLARGAYEANYGVLVDQIGLVLHPRIERAAASPDGLVGADGLIEIKCPKTAAHIQYLLAGVVPSTYQPQMLWQMACCEREWCDFVSYDPRLPPELQLFRARLQRDDKRIAEMEAEVIVFLREVDDLLAKLRTLK